MKTYIQITGGRGPVECARAVKIVADEILKFMKTNEIKSELVSYEAHNTEPGCFMSMIFSTENDCAKLRHEFAGTVQFISTKNPYRPNHKRKNWFVGVHFFSEAETIKIDERDIRYETSRSSGAGGQNVNKVESAVRAVHIPTGLACRCEDERNQTDNKRLAKERLILKLTEINDEKKAEQDRVMWNSHNTLERGNAVLTLKGSL